VNFHKRKMGILGLSDKWAAAVGAALASVYLILAILRSTNSTAVIGFVFLPVAILVGAFLGILTIWILRSFFELSVGKIQWKHPKVLVSLAILLLIFLGFGRYRQEKMILGDLEKSISSNNFEETYRKQFFFMGNEIRKYLVQHPELPVSLQQEIAKNSNSYLVGLMGKNPSLSRDVLDSIVNEAPKYERKFGVAENPNLSEAQMMKLLRVNQENFSSSTEFHLYQTYVMAPIIRRKDLTEVAFSTLSQFRDPEAFLLYAILESPFLKCENFTNFSADGNAVIEAAIGKKFQKLNCK
jgi:hypothetical protein